MTRWAKALSLSAAFGSATKAGRRSPLTPWGVSTWRCPAAAGATMCMGQRSCGSTMTAPRVAVAARRRSLIVGMSGRSRSSGTARRCGASAATIEEPTQSERSLSMTSGGRHSRFLRQPHHRPSRRVCRTEKSSHSTRGACGAALRTCRRSRGWMHRGGSSARFSPTNQWWSVSTRSRSAMAQRPHALALGAHGEMYVAVRSIDGRFSVLVIGAGADQPGKF